MFDMEALFGSKHVIYEVLMSFDENYEVLGWFQSFLSIHERFSHENQKKVDFGLIGYILLNAMYL